MKESEIQIKQESLLTGRAIWDIELTTRCNKSCHMCPRSGLTRTKQDMEIATFERFLDWLPDPGDMVFAGYGEPTLHPEYLTAVNLAARKGHGTSLMTNGKNLNPETLSAMFGSGLEKLQVSILYPGEIDRVPGLFTLSAPLQKEQFQLNFICGDLTKIDFERFNQWKKDGRSLMIKKIHNKAGLVTTPPNLDHGSCGTFFLVSYLNTDGDFHICSNDINGLHRLGNFEKVSHSQLMESKRSHFGNRPISPLCLSCTDEYRHKHFHKKGEKVDY